MDPSPPTAQIHKHCRDLAKNQMLRPHFASQGNAGATTALLLERMLQSATATSTLPAPHLPTGSTSPPPPNTHNTPQDKSSYYRLPACLPIAAAALSTLAGAVAVVLLCSRSCPSLSALTAVAAFCPYCCWSLLRLQTYADDTPPSLLLLFPLIGACVLEPLSAPKTPLNHPSRKKHAAAAALAAAAVAAAVHRSLCDPPPHPQRPAAKPSASQTVPLLLLLLPPLALLLLLLLLLLLCCCCRCAP